MDLNSFSNLDKRFSFKLLGKYIKKCRLDRGFTLEKMSQDLNIPRHDLAFIESGKKFLSQPEFDKIQSALNINSEELFEIKYIIESKYLIHMYKALDENFPK